jgi:predicted transcriptional regulator
MPSKHTYVDDEITKVVIELKSHDVNTEQYETILDRLGKLQKIRQEERNAYLSDLPSADTIVTSVTYLVGIVMILKHENLNVITSKALGFVPRVR